MPENLRTRRSADFARTPARMLALDVEDVVLHLERELMGISIRTSAPVGQPVSRRSLTVPVRAGCLPLEHRRLAR
jgi:hypothetical protein